MNDQMLSTMLIFKILVRVGQRQEYRHRVNVDMINYIILYYNIIYIIYIIYIIIYIIYIIIYIRQCWIGMNRIFGFFKQKISQAKEQNKQQLQALTSALTPQSQYSTQRVLSQLQSMKSNYMHWNLLIANQASTGLYYSQVHNRNICLRKIKANKQLKKTVQKNKMKLQFIKGTKDELMEIGRLSGNWMNQVNAQIQNIEQYLLAKQTRLANRKKVMQANVQNVENVENVQNVDSQMGGQMGQQQSSEQGEQQQGSKVQQAKAQAKQKQSKVQQIEDDQQ